MKAGRDYPGVAVIFYCHDGNGKFLFQKRSKNTRSHQGMWNTGAGGLELGERVDEAMFRELQEEHGCSGTISERLYPITFFDPNMEEMHHWVDFPFIVQVDPDKVVIGEPDKIDELGWFTLDNLPTPMHPAVAEEIEQYKSIFEKYTR